ncbi:hypothetical protein D3P07_22270 [Paenibacillus sp. 1011MAR3C5]|uniref:YhcN/YlaJ family sporulation lipoprotein n=1 Tax=Paenibacillus sp. 1011MAR3C5 TaxID=1675787 RepID=UPI000E6C9204|nr:YhcN/YlaJ family sporulation lipoprotein [Paenibacillus sp. 1011MAR3C5]RJE84658.1 hypothetical protein D3P07_22270 [Paenibacillus sp. 1011MAR3C5]
MRKKMMTLTAGVVLSAMLGGCGMEFQGDLGNKNIRQNSIRYDSSGSLIKDKRFADDGMNERNRVNGRHLRSNNLVGSHKNYRIEMSRAIADKLTEIDTVQSSSVMLADDNAYVAVSLDGGGLTMQSQNQNSGRTHIGLFSKDGAQTGKRMSSLSTGEDKLTEELKAQIASIVKELRPTIVHVYVSANPEFVGRMAAYMKDDEMGYPVQNYIMEFNGLVERVFPVVQPLTTDRGILKTTSVSRKYRILD